MQRVVLRPQTKSCCRGAWRHGSHGATVCIRHTGGSVYQRNPRPQLWSHVCLMWLNADWSTLRCRLASSAVACTHQCGGGPPCTVCICHPIICTRYQSQRPISWSLTRGPTLHGIPLTITIVHPVLIRCRSRKYLIEAYIYHVSMTCHMSMVHAPHAALKRGRVI